jgi:hypothetical protein
VQQDLQVKRLVIVVRHHEGRRQTPAAQRDAVDQVEGVTPQLLGLLVQTRRAEAKVELYAQVGAALG